MRALVIDDTQSKRGTLVRYLELYGWEVTDFEDLTQGIAATESGEFDIVFVDDQLKEGNRKARLGSEAIRAIRSRLINCNPYIVGYTSINASPYPERYLKPLLAAGANEALLMPDVLDRGNSWKETVIKHKTDRLGEVQLVGPTDLATRAAIEKVGQLTLQGILRQELGAGAARAHSLSGGLSGDVVLLLNFETTDRREHYVFKFSRIREGLERELTGVPSQATAFHAVGLKKVSDRPVNGWWAGFAPYVPSSRTLEALLLRAKSPATGTRLSSILWKDTLVNQFEQAKRIDSDLAQTISLSASFVYGVDRAAADVARALEHVYRKPDLAERVNDLARRISDKEGNVWPFSATEELWCHSHGDFHARNILFTRQTPFVIDWANASQGPRGLDVSALVADLVVAAPDLGLAKQWSAGSIEREARLFMEMVRLVGADRPLTSERAIMMFTWDLLRRATRSSGSIVEMSRALCFQFLRYMRFASLPTPRRAVAALIAVRLADLIG